MILERWGREICSNWEPTKTFSIRSPRRPSIIDTEEYILWKTPRTPSSIFARNSRVAKMLSLVLSSVNFGELRRAFFKWPEQRDPNVMLAARQGPLHSMQINISVCLGKEPWYWACKSRGNMKATYWAGSSKRLWMGQWKLRIGQPDLGLTTNLHINAVVETSESAQYQSS